MTQRPDTHSRYAPIFAVAGAQARTREQPQAERHLLEAGDFATNDCAAEIASRVLECLARIPP